MSNALPNTLRRMILDKLPTGFCLMQVIPELETGGAEQTTLDIAAAVIAAGGRAMVVSRGGRMADRLRACGAQLVELPVHSKNPLTILANAFLLARLIQSEKVSILHARSRAPAVSGYLAAKLGRIPFVATYHGVYNARSALKRWYNAVMTRGPLVIANSGYTRAHVINEHHIHPERVIAIPRGVDLQRFDPAAVSMDRQTKLAHDWGLEPRPAGLICLMAARLTRWKGQSLIIDAIGRLTPQEQQHITLILAGDNQGRTDYHDELKGMIVERSLQTRIRIVGHCDDMPAAYLLADIALAPSLEPEAFGRTAVEPQIMGRPVMASDDGGFRETIDAGVSGWLIPPGNPDAWTDALRKALVLKPQDLAMMGQKARERAMRLYSVEAMCEATMGVYRHLLQTRHPSA